MMATVILLNIDVQVHGGSNILLKVDGRTPICTVNLLYSGAQIDLNRGNHYDPLTPKGDPPIPPDSGTSSKKSEWIRIGKGRNTHTLMESLPPDTVVEISPLSPSNCRTKSPPISRSSFTPLSKHEMKEPWNRQWGIHSKLPSVQQQVVQTGKGGTGRSGRRYVSSLSKNKGKSPPKDCHRNTSYTPKDTSQITKTKRRYRQKNLRTQDIKTVWDEQLWADVKVLGHKVLGDSGGIKNIHICS